MAPETLLKVSNYTFSGIAILFALVALYKWAEYLLVWKDSYAMAEGFTWTILTLGAFGIVFLIEYLQNRWVGDDTQSA